MTKTKVTKKGRIPSEEADLNFRDVKKFYRTPIKDNRVRVFAPYIHKLFEPEYGHELLGICRKVDRMTQSKSQTIFAYKKKDLRNEKAKTDIEKSFKLLINELLFSENVGSDTDDNW